jgi:hypothetical protein
MRSRAQWFKNTKHRKTGPGGKIGDGCFEIPFTLAMGREWVDNLKDGNEEGC